MHCKWKELYMSVCTCPYGCLSVNKFWVCLSLMSTAHGPPFHSPSFGRPVRRISGKKLLISFQLSNRVFYFQYFSFLSSLSQLNVFLYIISFLILFLYGFSLVLLRSVGFPASKAKIAIVFGSLLVSLPKYKYSFVYKLWRSFYKSSQTATSHSTESSEACSPVVLWPQAQTQTQTRDPAIHLVRCASFISLLSVSASFNPPDGFATAFHWLNAIAIDIDFDFDLDPKP